MPPPRKAKHISQFERAGHERQGLGGRRSQGPGSGAIWILAILLVLSVFLNIVLGTSAAGRTAGTRIPGSTSSRAGIIEYEVSPGGEDKVALIELSGVIQEGLGSMFLGVGSDLEFLKDQFEIAGDRDEIKAVIFKINSPGGTVTASDNFHHYLEDWRKFYQKPVIVFMGDVCASGGVYIASACDVLMAQPTTTTGSVGVILSFFQVQKLLGDLGVESINITSGEFKDMGSMYRAPSAEEDALFHDMIDEMYGRFVELVEGGRNRLSDSQRSRLKLPSVGNWTIDRLAYGAADDDADNAGAGKQGSAESGDESTDEVQSDELDDDGVLHANSDESGSVAFRKDTGMVFTATQALERGLIDQIGYFEDAVKLISKIAGVSNPTIVSYAMPVTFFDALMGAERQPTIMDLKMYSGPKFLYLWPAP
ncbi:MAG: S49 family peptidase [Planctomycetes bacterium]|nr:S49 family peptidase [Planctomycetota bacterium]